MHRICVLLIAVLISSSLCADTVIFDNGDTITGKIVSLLDGELIFETDHLDTLTIDIKKVKRLDTDRSHDIRWRDGSLTNTTIASDEKGGLTINAPLNESFWGGSFWNLSWYDPPPSSAQPHYLAGGIKEIKSINREKVSWRGSLSAGGSDSSGSTDRRNLDIAGELSRDFERAKVEIRYRGEFAEEDSETTAYNNFLFGKYEYDLNARIFSYISEELSNDKLDDSKLKSILSCGAGYRFFNKKNYDLSADIGISYLEEMRYNDPNTNELTSRIGLDGSYKINDRISLDESFYYNHTNETHKAIIRNEFSVDTALIEGWSFDVTHIYDYESSGSENSPKSDRRFIFSLKYNF